MPSIFEYLDHSSYLRDMADQNQKTYRYKSLMAEAAGCQQSFLSQVLAGRASLMPNHAVGLAQFWGLSAIETQYWVELVNLARAGSPAHRRYLESRLKALRSENEDLGQRYKRHGPSEEASKSAIYYSSWHYSAIHILLTIPEMQKAEAIAQRLALPLDMIETSLRELENMGLIYEEGGEWCPTKQNIHIEYGSPFHGLNHHHWRIKSIEKAARKLPADLFYTGIYSLSASDWRQIRSLCLTFLDQTRDIVQASPAEELVCFNLDVFKI